MPLSTLPCALLGLPTARARRVQLALEDPRARAVCHADITGPAAKVARVIVTRDGWDYSALRGAILDGAVSIAVSTTATAWVMGPVTLPGVPVTAQVRTSARASSLSRALPARNAQMEGSELIASSSRQHAA